MDDGKAPPRGRFERFRKLATLSASLGSDVVTRGVRRLAGADPDLLGKGAAEKLVATLGDLKGAAMKLGQMASMDPDLFPPEVLKVLTRLQNEAPSMPFSLVADVFDDEFGKPPSELYASFDEKPLAAASLGQVHRATLHDGRLVAVKVQYPGIGDALKADLDNLGAIVKAFSLTSKLMDGRAYFREVAEQMAFELDYVREAELARLMGAATRLFPDLKVPDVVPELTSKRVLTLEFLPGETLKAFLAREASNDERYRVSRQLIIAINGPFLVSGLVHADPHPGNFMVMPDGRLGLMDFGAVKQFSEAFHRAHARVYAQAVRQRPLEVLHLMREVGFTIDLPDSESEPLVREILDIAGRPLKTDFYDFAQCTASVDTKKLFAKNPTRFLKIRPPPEAVMFGRSFGGLSQNLKQLGAHGNFRRVYEELVPLVPDLAPSPR